MNDNVGNSTRITSSKWKGTAGYGPGPSLQFQAREWASGVSTGAASVGAKTSGATTVESQRNIRVAVSVAGPGKSRPQAMQYRRSSNYR